MGEEGRRRKRRRWLDDGGRFKRTADDGLAGADGFYFGTLRDAPRGLASAPQGGGVDASLPGSLAVGHVPR